MLIHASVRRSTNVACVAATENPSPEPPTRYSLVAMLFDHTSVTVDSIHELAEATIAEGEELIAAIVDASDPRTFESTVAPMESVEVLMATAAGRGPFAAHVSTDADVRNAARAAEERLTKWSLELAYRDELYEAIKTFAESDAGQALEGEDRRYLDFLLRDFRMAGQELDPDGRARVQEMRGRMVELEIAFATNLAEYDDGMVITAGDLDGLPDDFVARLSPGDTPGTYRVGLDYPDVIPFMDNSTRRDLREELSSKFNRRAIDTNRPVLEEAIALRGKIAREFGVNSWAHYRMETKMAKNPENVAEFYASLVPPLTEAGLAERSAMETMLHADGHAGPLMTWDRRFYHTQQMKQDHGIDPNAVASYFPLDQVLDGMFAITQEAFGLTYQQIEPTTAWHPDVTLYEVNDADSGELIGHFYMDLFPRDGKFSHAAAFPLVPGSAGPDGEYNSPVSAIVANMTKPTDDGPSLLQHQEVVTLFHEFGHILHMTLTTARHARFSAANTEWDFVEAPSQIMENWCWRADVLATFARHHETGEPIDEALVGRLAAARNLNVALNTLRQIYLGHIDLDIHSTIEPVDPQEVEIGRSDLMLVPHQEGTFMMASFGHLLGGYDAGYYGYLWSEVFGHDMFSQFEAEGVVSPSVGRRYRREILEPNGSRDALELLRSFLGREPNNEAFLEQLGIS